MVPESTRGGGGVRVFDQIILTLYIFTLAAISVIAVFASLHVWQPQLWIDAGLTSTPGRLFIGLAGAIFFVVSFRLIYAAFRRRGAGQAVVHETALGNVRISLDAVENLVRKVARGIKGVREMQAEVGRSPDGLSIGLRGVISPDVSIPEVSEEIQTAVKSYVRRVVGVDVAEVRIEVENITNESRRSRLD